jgi:hypothetical protein
MAAAAASARATAVVEKVGTTCIAVARAMVAAADGLRRQLPRATMANASTAGVARGGRAGAARAEGVAAAAACEGGRAGLLVERNEGEEKKWKGNRISMCRWVMGCRWVRWPYRTFFVLPRADH